MRRNIMLWYGVVPCVLYGELTMTELAVRRLLIDLETPFERHWCGGDAFRTALFNALSMSFPVGEQFFIDSVRNGYKALPEEKQPQYKDEVRGFVGQEATHRWIHALFNGHLDRFGLVNKWGPRAQERLKLMAGTDPRHWLAITAANEHFTAIFAEWMLRNHDLLDGCEPRLKTLWLWHSAEESEHKSIAFDLYQALGGNYEWRIKWFRRITYVFLSDLLVQTVENLKRDGTLWTWSTWKSAGSYLFGKRGIFRQTYRPWREYLRADFHPSQQESDLSQRWLEDNSGKYSLVGAA
jgi:predicted metal-dependent hydrolase